MGFLLNFISIAVAFMAAVVVKMRVLDSKPNSSQFIAKTTSGSTMVPVRMFQAVVYQFLDQNPVCDKDSDLVGQLLVITGGNTGIGYETVKGLVQRGGDVIMVCRSSKKCADAEDSIRKSLESTNSFKGSLRFMVADMSDINSVVALSKSIQQLYNGQRSVDKLILNAGVWPNSHSYSAQGHEIAFATNTLGPFVLVRSMIDQQMLSTSAKVIYVTGDIYITLFGSADEGCTPQYEYSTLAGGQNAYSRSKLGFMWLMQEFKTRYPALIWNMVHPGVMDNGLAGDMAGDLPAFLKIDNEMGAQTTLICATSQTENGAYYHNTLGKFVLSPSDPVMNMSRAHEFWEIMDTIAAPYLDLRN